MKLGTKLLVSFLAVGVIPFAVVGGISLYKSSNALSQSAFNQLHSMREVKKFQMEGFFKERRGDMGVLVETVGTLRREAMGKLAGIRDIKSYQILTYFGQRLQLMSDTQKNLRYTIGLPAFTDAFAAGTDSGDYREIWDKRHPGLKTHCETYGFYNLFLIDPSGNVVYTVTRESDLGQNLTSGELQDSGLAEAFRKGSQGVSFVDFRWYAPSDGVAAFFSTPINDEQGTFAGVAAFQASLKQVNEIMQIRTGMGKTGETYLVGPDMKMRSDSFLDPKGHSVKASFAGTVAANGCDTEAVHRALAGKTGSDVIMDYFGNPVLSAYTPVSFGGVEWALLAEIDVAEAFSPVDRNGKEFFAKYSEMYGYYDLFLFNPDGYCFYSVVKKSDYQTNLVDGQYASSSLGKLVRQVLETGQFGLMDFEPYAPSNGVPAAFIAQPVIHNGKVESIVALKLSLDAINGVMQQREGMGQTGETYLVGSDKLMRSDSFLDPTNHSVKASFANPAKGRVDTHAVREALSGNTDEQIIIDYNGNPVLSAYTPLKIGETIWAIIAEIDEAEAFASVKAIQWLIGIIALVGIAGILVVALLITRSITRPVNRVIEALSSGAEQVASASGQVSSASHQLAEGSSEQAASIEETSSSLEEMSSMTKQNADNAGRAGEAGAGFAVVADEVRNLAMRAAEAAKNTATLIEGTVKKVNAGSDLVSRANEAFGHVAQSASKVGELVGEIAAASNEQSQGIGQVNTEVAEMDKVVQFNAANAEESASASEEMNSQAEQMKVAVEDLVGIVGSAASGKKSQPAASTRLHLKKITTKREQNHLPIKREAKSHESEISPQQAIPLDDKDFYDF